MPSSLVVASLSNMSPSLRGSGLKLHRFGRFFYNLMSPSLRGSGLKSHSGKKSKTCCNVSLFTREWIEIASDDNSLIFPTGLPLYEGVD